MGSYRQCWMTSDEEVFTSEEEAELHQKRLDRCERIDEILRDKNTMPKNRTKHEDEVLVDFLMGNWSTLYQFFKEEGEE